MSPAFDVLGNLHVFAIRPDGQVYVETEIGVNQWSNWALVYPGQALQVVTPMTTTSTSLVLQVYILGTDHQAWTSTYNATTKGWNTWSLTASGKVEEISAMSNTLGNTLIFAIGTDGQVWYETSTPSPKTLNGRGWSGWTLTYPGRALAITAPIIAQNSSQLQAFIIGTDGQVWSETTNGSGGWNAWALAAPGQVQEISTITNGAGSPEILAQGLDTFFYVATQNPTTKQWSGWDFLR
jgi:hypothetical protein